MSHNLVQHQISMLKEVRVKKKITIDIVFLCPETPLPLPFRIHMQKKGNTGQMYYILGTMSYLINTILIN